MKLTRKQAIKEHRKMWNWLAEHPEKDKGDYLESNDFEYNGFEYVESECFLCHYNHQNEGKYCGEECIIDWGDTGGCIGTTFNLGLYKVYYELTSLLCGTNKNSEWGKDIAKGLQLIISHTAKAIAELPEKEG